ncbi:tetratricopeptide repeat protein [Plantactinospora sp. B6F1]|uniref:ATP-binding protein n=1 Tax=Plantactinospora sp. B6F1 TaxID=3158971 RepID=UPI0032D9005A
MSQLRNGERQPVNGDGQPPNGSGRPVTGNGQPVTGDRQLTNGDGQLTNGDGRPDPGAADTAAEFVTALRRLKSWSGMGLRRLERQAATAGQALPRSTMAAVFSRDVLPREDLVVALVRVCGGDQDEVDRWLAARRRIAAGTPRPAPPPDGTPQPVRRTLPIDQAVFVGRDKELAQITAAVADAALAGGVIAIHAIDGMPGIGKTTLAVHVAHRLTDRFGDRQLFIDLRAHTPGQAPVPPEEALAQLLVADGLDPRLVPETLDGRASLWRDRMAGKRLLLILDNAASSRQVAPLLPGCAEGLVLVTSRRSLADLPTAVPIGLDLLSTEEAVTMFLRLAPRAAPDRRAVAELVRLCGHLPLAISIMASLYVRHPTWSIEELIKEVRQSVGGGPLTLSAESRTVADVFDVSYQQLTPDGQRFFRLLSVHPGTEVDPYAAAALANMSLRDALAQLDRLHADHLIEESAYRRYRMHDLIRAHAATLAATTDSAQVRREALGRLLDFYRHTATVAVRVAYPHARPPGRDGAPVSGPAGSFPRPASKSSGPASRFPGPAPRFPGPAPEFLGPDQAARWLDTELANLLAAAEHATEYEWPEHLLQLSAQLHPHLFIRGHYREAEALHRRAQQLAHRLDRPAAELDVLICLGHLYRMQDYDQQATDHYRQALGMAGNIGDRAGELHALLGLGATHRARGGHEQAVSHFQRALRIAEVIGDRNGELDALNRLGETRRIQGRHDLSADNFRRAIQVARAVGDRGGELNAVNGLGHVHRLQGRYREAADHYERAIQLAQAVGSRNGKLNALNGLGHALRLQGHFPEAASHYQQALEIAQAIGNRSGRLTALIGLGHTYRFHEHYDQATDTYRQALDLAREIGSGNWQFEALQGLGRLHQTIGRPDLALSNHEQALELATKLAQPADQARAHDGLARAHRDGGREDLARQHWQLALDILTELGAEHTDESQVSAANIRASLAGG